jgi:hypothetical protein
MRVKADKGLKQGQRVKNLRPKARKPDRFQLMVLALIKLIFRIK